MALKLTLEPLPQGRQLAFSEWLANSTNVDTLRKVVLSLATKAEVEAVNRTELSEKFPQEINPANDAVQAARRYLHFIEVLHEISTAKTHQTVTHATTEPNVNPS